MNTILVLVVLLVGAAIGAVAGYFYARARMTAEQADLAARATASDERARAAEQQAGLVDGYLAERFAALSAQALDASQRRLVELTSSSLQAAGLRSTGELDARKNAVEQLVEPLKLTLARVEAQLREAENARQTSHATLAEQVRSATRATDQLRAETQSLVTALRRPEARGRWGEMQLRRVAELAGMAARCDFDEQVSVTDGDGAMLRPDMVVRLAGGKNIVVDSKVSLAAYLEAAETSDPDVREARLDAHARHLREHVDRLAGKAYWAALSPAPEFVVLFIPGEAFLAPALERDPSLLEHAIRCRVHIATPTTLVTMLRTAQYAWQQEALTENARAVFDLGRELYDRLQGFGGHMESVGRSLTGAVTVYNKAVGSLESRLLVTARKLNQLGVTDTPLSPARAVEVTARQLSAAELATDVAVEGPARSPAGSAAEAPVAGPCTVPAPALAPGASNGNGSHPDQTGPGRAAR